MNDTSGDPVLDRYWLPMLLITSVLFAIERILIWQYLDVQGNYGLIVFLFGEPPLNIVDIIFGLSLNFNSAIDLLNIRNMVLMAIQATHFYANFFVVNWLYRRFVK
jgi:hypothetical protein